MSGSLSEQVASFGDWISQFEFQGVRYGGTYDPSNDQRVLRFIRELRTYAPTIDRAGDRFRILECGAFEGAQTAMLANAFPQAEIIAVEAREQSIQKAKFLHSLYGLTNIRYVQDDLDDPRLTFGESYDVILCMGVLYHLRNPAQFLSRACAAAPFLWVWSVICAEAEVCVVDDGYHGRILPETPDHPLSGVRSESFLPTISSLVEMLWKAGYHTIELLENVMTTNNNGPAVLLQAQRAAESFRTKTPNQAMQRTAGRAAFPLRCLPH